MMTNLEIFVTNYGYLAIFLGTLLEGETILVIGGFLAHRGYMKLQLVILLAFFGTLISDQALFMIGRIKGKNFVKKYNFLKSKMNSVNLFLKNNENYVLFGFRFIYGLRILTPLVLGASSVKPKNLSFSIFSVRLSGRCVLEWPVT